MFSMVPRREPKESERLAAIRAKIEDDFHHWLNGNWWNEEDQEFRDHLELEYPWLFINERELDDPEDLKWINYEFNCYVNSIYDPRRRI